MERKLTTIFAADVAGYSTLMEADEEGTHERLKASRQELFEPEIARHHGRIFKLMGDGLLAEFGSVVDAVECAVSLQRGLAERNAHVPDDHRIRLRIGINLGEVIVEGDDRYGEGVNIAARLEQLADPGGICVSGKVATEVEKKLAFGFESMGEQKVKNITEPVPAFRVRIDGAPVAKRRGRPFSANRRLPLASLVLVLIAAMGASLGWYFLAIPQRPAGPPSLAVLPFANLSGDASQDYMGLGIANDIITMLSTSPLIRVVSKTSSFKYSRPEKVQNVARELGVTYVLEGSAGKSEGKFKITAQLIDGRTGENVWSNRFEGEGSDIARLQESIATKVYSSLGGLKGEIINLEERSAWSKSGPGLEEYDYHLRGANQFFKFTAEGKAEAKRIWREGLDKYPDSALLRLEIAGANFNDATEGPSDDPWQSLHSAWDLVREAEAKPAKSRMENWLVHYLLALLYPLVEGDFERGAEEAEAAHALVPYDSFSHADLAQVMTRAGMTDRGVEWAEFAVHSEENPPRWFYHSLAWIYYHADRPADALAIWDKINEPCRMCRAVALARLGRVEEARVLIARQIKDRPGLNLRDEALSPGGRYPIMVNRLLKPFLADLAKAGVPKN
jgi:adenylate cyclase